jgi:microcystin-dependent protein
VWAWLTPDNAPGGDRCLRLVIPSGDEWEAIIRGALAPLLRSENFEYYGSYLPEETAQVFRDYAGQWMQWERCVSVGTVLWCAGDNLPGFALWCDGAEIEQTDYPVLYGVLGNAWGSAAPGKFKLPDLRSRVPIGAGQGGGLSAYAIGDYGGEETHQLSIAEMPEHSHSVHDHEMGACGELPIPCSTPALFGTQTGSTGGDQAHENRPPYAALRAYIIAR